MGRWLLLFVLGVIAILMVSPLILTIFTSLKPMTELVNPPWYPPVNITFEHYTRVWSEGGFSRYFFNSLLISVVDAIVMIFIASLAAYAMVFMNFRGKMVLQILFLIGLMIPVTAIVLPLFQVVRTFNLLNTHLGVILPDLALAVSVFVFLFSSYFVNLPTALHEAAKLDGANEFQIYLKVIMPIATPVIVTTALLEFLWSWNDLLLRLLIMTREEMRTLSVGLLNFQGTMTRDVTGLSSGTLIMAIPVIILFVFFQRHFVRGMTSGAVK